MSFRGSRITRRPKTYYKLTNHNKSDLYLLADINELPMSRQDGSIRLSEDPANRLGVLRHRSRHDASDWTASGGRRRDVVRPDDAVGVDFFNSDPEAVDDSLIGCDSDLESSRRGHSYPRSHTHGHAQRRRQVGPAYRVFIALFDYDPSSMSPNPGAIYEELPFCEGQLIKVLADVSLC